MRYASRGLAKTTRRSRRAAAIALAAALLLMTSCACSADSLYVICNPAVVLSPDDLHDVFLGEKQFSGRIRLAPADNRAAQVIFLEKVLKMTAAKYSTSWIKKSFRDGVNALPVKGSDAETMAYVKSEKGGCSYVLSQPDASVAIVAAITT